MNSLELRDNFIADEIKICFIYSFMLQGNPYKDESFKISNIQKRLNTLFDNYRQGVNVQPNLKLLDTPIVFNYEEEEETTGLGISPYLNTYSPLLLLLPKPVSKHVNIKFSNNSSEWKAEITGRIKLWCSGQGVLEINILPEKNDKNPFTPKDIIYLANIDCSYQMPVKMTIDGIDSSEFLYENYINFIGNLWKDINYKEFHSNKFTSEEREIPIKKLIDIFKKEDTPERNDIEDKLSKLRFNWYEMIPIKRGLPIIDGEKIKPQHPYVVSIIKLEKSNNILSCLNKLEEVIQRNEQPIKESKQNFPNKITEDLLSKKYLIERDIAGMLTRHIGWKNLNSAYVQELGSMKKSLISSSEMFVNIHHRSCLLIWEKGKYFVEKGLGSQTVQSILDAILILRCRWHSYIIINAFIDNKIMDVASRIRGKINKSPIKSIIKDVLDFREDISESLEDPLTHRSATATATDVYSKGIQLFKLQELQDTILKKMDYLDQFISNLKQRSIEQRGIKFTLILFGSFILFTFLWNLLPLLTQKLSCPLLSDFSGFINKIGLFEIGIIFTITLLLYSLYLFRKKKR